GCAAGVSLDGASGSHRLARRSAAAERYRRLHPPLERYEPAASSVRGLTYDSGRTGQATFARHSRCAAWRSAVLVATAVGRARGSRRKQAAKTTATSLNPGT